MDFVAIDVETANHDLASICQVGIVTFRDGRVADSWQSLVDPEDYFHSIHVSIHGIDEKAVQGAPTFPEIYSRLTDHLSGNISVCHSPFDKNSIHKVIGKYDLSGMRCAWLDTVRVARRAWPEFARLGYSLKNVANQLGIEFTPHIAQEDARAAGEILLRAITERDADLKIVEWMENAKRCTAVLHDPSLSSRENDPPTDSLLDEVIVFTGSLLVPRKEATQMATNAGGRVDAGVTARTTLLVVGDQDIARLAGHDKSSKHRKAEDLIARGQPIRILSESDLQRLMRSQA